MTLREAVKKSAEAIDFPLADAVADGKSVECALIYTDGANSGWITVSIPVEALASRQEVISRHIEPAVAQMLQALVKSGDGLINPIVEEPPTPVDPVCPFCGETIDPIVKVRDVEICGHCGGSVFVKDGVVRPSRHSDLETLDISEMAQLRRGRGSVARPDRKQR